jgi:hypothetical protein
MTFGSVVGESWFSKSAMRVRKMLARNETPRRRTEPRVAAARPPRFRVSWLLLLLLFLLALVAIAIPGHARARVPDRQTPILTTNSYEI